ncbi:hypothetical protein DSAG12_02800 [Promethearchaeum syntrophicum]|uniref:Peptidase A2 domain-containing protein n=1 Tax=Promethearchaeum syntrophicum TaxID=2594042 RepID=A0A5B9DCE3_9ARCH|nr:hypothetical protein [Candidatus Prometheoarchaeum syntrophicum]
MYRSGNELIPIKQEDLIPNPEFDEYNQMLIDNYGNLLTKELTKYNELIEYLRNKQDDDIFWDELADSISSSMKMVRNTGIKLTKSNLEMSEVNLQKLTQKVQKQIDKAREGLNFEEGDEALINYIYKKEGLVQKIFMTFGNIDWQSKRITENFEIKGVKSKNIKGLIDTGAQCSVLDFNVAKRIARFTGQKKRIGGLGASSSVEIVEFKIKIPNKYVDNKKSTYINMRIPCWYGLSNRTGGYPLLIGMDFWEIAKKKGLNFTLQL